MWKQRHVLRSPDDDEGGGGAAAPAPAPAAAPAAAPVAAPAPAASAPAAAPAAAPAPAEPKAGEGYWPADWRQNYAKDDVKKMERLQRYQSPAAAFDALFAAQSKISSGELKPVLGKNATPEEVADYRKSLGIPEAPDKYDLGKDVAISDAEMPLMSKLFKAAHDTNQTPEQVKASVKAWREVQTVVAEEMAQRDAKVMKDSEDALRAEWGLEFRKNINLIHGMLDGAGSQELKDRVLQSRLPDGTPFASSPEVLKFLAGLALIQNPAGVVVPGSEANPLKGVDDEITRIEKVMREDRKTYNKDEAMQSRYRELLGARETLKTRKAA